MYSKIKVVDLANILFVLRIDATNIRIIKTTLLLTLINK